MKWKKLRPRDQREAAKVSARVGVQAPNRIQVYPVQKVVWPTSRPSGHKNANTCQGRAGGEMACEQWVLLGVSKHRPQRHRWPKFCFG